LEKCISEVDIACAGILPENTSSNLVIVRIFDRYSHELKNDFKFTIYIYYLGYKYAICNLPRV
jgi:hypothetical protein